MTELPDDELDKLFRKSSEELDPYFDPEDWNDLKKRLDAEDGIRTGGWLRRWWPLGVVLLFISMGLITYFGMNNEQAARSGEAKTGVGISGEGERLKTKNTEPLVSESKREALTKAGKNDRTSVSKKLTLTKSDTGKILPPSRSKAGGVFLEPDRSRGRVGEGAFSSNSKSKFPKEVSSIKSAAHKTGLKLSEKTAHAVRVGKAEVDGSQIIAGANTPVNVNRHVPESKVNNPSISGVNALASNPGTLELLMPEKLQHRPIHSGVNMSLPEVVFVKSESQNQPPITAQQTSPTFAVRFGYAPDLSTVGFKGFSKPGAAVSLLAEYQVIKRLYLQSGVIWSNKVYRGDSADYDIPKELHYYGPKAIGLAGVCKVFELPVNLRYDIFQGEKSRWYAGAGVSSYHMNAETYTYKFENDKDPRITAKYRGWRGSTGWWWLSHINASAGYEYRISKNLSLMAEPYVRLPLKGVGYGKVRLVTTGVWLSVRCTPFFK